MKRVCGPGTGRGEETDVDERRKGAVTTRRSREENGRHERR